VTTLKEHMSNDLSVFYDTDEFAVDAQYTPKATGVAVQVKVIVDEGVVENDDGMQSDDFEHILTCERDTRSGFGSFITRSVITVRVRVSDVAVPAVYDEIDIDGSVFRVVEMYDRA